MSRPMDRTYISDRHGVMLLVVAILILPWVLLASAAFNQWRAYDDWIDREGPRIARLQGQVESAEALQGKAGRVQAYLDSLSYSAEAGASQVLGDLQSRVRQQVEAAGLELQGTQQHSPRREEGFERLAITVSIGGHLRGLVALLQALQASEPGIFIEQVLIQPAILATEPDRELPPVVNVTLRLTVFRQI